MALSVLGKIFNAVVEDIKSGRKSRKNDKMSLSNWGLHIKKQLLLRVQSKKLFKIRIGIVKEVICQVEVNSANPELLKTFKSRT